VIRRRLREALGWRFGAVTERLDALGSRMDGLEARLVAFDDRFTELDATRDELRHLTALLGQLVENASEARTAIEQRVQPMLRAILDEESGNRRRLFELRDSAAYGEAYSDPDPLVSVVLATVGRGDLLVSRSLPSLLSQSHTNLEILVVGDAAQPEVGDAVNAIGDPRVHYANLTQRLVTHPEPERHWLVGSTMARNEAARRATGRWLLHFDDDDRLRPAAIASLLELAREHRAEVAYGGFEAHAPDGRRKPHVGFPPKGGDFAWPGALMHGGLRFFERELVAAHLQIPGDIYMLERMLRVGVRFAMLDEVVLDYFPSRLWESVGDAERPPRTTPGL
jgi:Glycosyl transferase family 2